MSDKTAEQLRAIPCPFCGREVEVVMQGGVFSDRFWYVYHPDLDGNCILEDQKFASLRGWNNRHTEDTRADSGEAVAFDGPQDDRAMLLYLMQAFDTESWQCPQCGKDEDCATMDSAYLLRDYLSTHPRATSVDARYVTVKHPRFFNEEENNAWHRALPDLMAAFDAIAAIASREGEVS